MQILLHHDVGAAGEIRILVADECSLVQAVPGRVLRAIHESQKIAVVEVTETLHLVDDGDGVAERVEEKSFQFEAHVAPLGTNVEEQISRSRHGGVGRP